MPVVVVHNPDPGEDKEVLARLFPQSESTPSPSLGEIGSNLPSARSLFHKGDSVMVVVADKATAAEVRQAAHDHPDRNVCLIVRRKMLTTFDKDPDVDYQTWDVTPRRLSDQVGPLLALEIQRKFPKDEDRSSVVEQLLLLPEEQRKQYLGLVYAPQHEEHTIWGVTDMICEGVPELALAHTDNALKLGVAPEAMAMQVAGYMRKVLASSNDEAGFIEESKLRFFAPKSRRIRNEAALATQIARCDDVLQAPKVARRPALRAYIAGLAGQFNPSLQELNYGT